MFRGRFAKTSGNALTVLLAALVGLSAVAISGGCGKSPEEAKKELDKLKKKEKPKPPFDQLRVLTEPNEKYVLAPPKEKKKEPQDELDKLIEERMPEKEDEEEETIQAMVSRAIKPGHWTGILLHAKANNFDWSGELASSPQDNRQNPIDLERSPFQLITSRPGALPKGQPKILETVFFAPRPDPALKRTTTWIATRLLDRQRGGEESLQQPEILQHMPDFQYYLYVLSRDPNRYRYLKVLDSVRPPVELVTFNIEDGFYYRVLTPKPGEPLALPNQSLCWTSLAYIVWDDILPTALSEAQQRALVDWLHWGGGLIISGPQTLDALRGSFLEPYLPATAAATQDLDADALAALNEHWTLSGTNSEPITLAEPWSGVKLAKHADAEFMPNTGELVVERRVGRGRVVATAFRLSEKELLNWRSFDSFVNACLFRRPPREFDDRRQQFEFVTKDSSDKPERFEPGLVSNVRFLTRDDPAALGGGNTKERNAVQEAIDAAGTGIPANAVLRNTAYGRYTSDAEMEALKGLSGPAGWNDFGQISSAARQALRSAAGIAVPKRDFVMWMVGGYLVAIVPINWLVFRMLGRVEYAWIAVPVLAIGWGMAVIYMAQLDIGFARAETEVDVLELQAGYPRAHLTRYTALYSSLSTSYDAVFDDATAVALPFSTDVNILAGQARSTVTLEKAADNALQDFIVRSNSTGMVHSEQMLDLEGTVDWQPTADGGLLENNSKLKLSGVAVIRRPPTSAKGAGLEAAWVGDLKPGATFEMAFAPYEPKDFDTQRRESPITSDDPPENTLSVRALLEVVEADQAFAPGDVRLVAWREDGLGGVHFIPSASQARRVTLIVANLKFGRGATPEPDKNLRTQLKNREEFEPPPPIQTPPPSRSRAKRAPGKTK